MHLFKQWVVLELSNSSETQLNVSPSAHGPGLLCLRYVSPLVPCHPPGLHRSPSQSQLLCRHRDTWMNFCCGQTHHSPAASPSAATEQFWLKFFWGEGRGEMSS